MTKLLKCGNTETYKGLRAPTCGCEACAKKYRERIAKIAKLVRMYHS